MARYMQRPENALKRANGKLKKVHIEYRHSIKMVAARNVPQPRWLFFFITNN